MTAKGDMCGLTAAEVAALGRWLPRNGRVALIGAGLGVTALRGRLAQLATTAPAGGGLIIAILPPESFHAPADPSRLPDERAIRGAALHWLVRNAAPALAPGWRLNGITGIATAEDTSARACLMWLLDARSVTGQVFSLDGVAPSRGPT